MRNDQNSESVISFNPAYIDYLRVQVQDTDTEVSLESFFLVLKKIIPNAVKSFLGFSKTLDVKKITLPTLEKKELNRIKDISSRVYLDMVDRTCFIPPYYTGTYVQYGDLLKRFSEYSLELTNNLAYFEERIGIILSDEKGQMSDFSQDIKVYNTWRVKREDLKKELASLFTSKNTSDETMYKQVIRRQADWQEIVDLLGDIEKNVYAVDKDKIKPSVNRISEYLVSIKKMLDDNQLENASKELGRHISIGALEMAEQIEFFSLLIFQHDIFFKTIKDTVSVLTDK